MKARLHRLAGACALSLAFAACDVGSGHADRIPEPPTRFLKEGTPHFDRARHGSAADLAEYGRWLHAQGAFGAAAKTYALALAELSDSRTVAKIAWLHALALDQAGLDVTAALADARRRSADFPQVWRLSSERALDRGQVEDAYNFAQRAATLDPKDAMARVLEARALRALGRLVDAEAVVIDALRIDSDLPAARHLRGVVGLELDRADASIWLGGTPPRRSDVSRDPIYREVLELGCGVEASLARAEGLANAGKLTDALRVLLPHASRPEASVEVLMATAELRFKLGQKAEARHLWQRVAEMPERSSLAFERLATLAMDGGSFEEASSYAERALELDRGSAAGLLVRGAVQLKRRAWMEAVLDLRKVRKLRPEWELARSLLGDALVNAARAIPGGVESERGRALMLEAEALKQNQTLPR